MSDWFLLYLLTRVDALKMALEFMSFLSVIVWVFILAAHAAIVIHSEGFGLEERCALKKATKFVVSASIVIWVLAAVTPSRNDIIFIVGGSALIEAAQSDRAKSIGSKTLDVVEKYLDDAAKGDAK